MGPFFSFVGVEGGKVRPRAAVVAGLVAALALLAVLRGGPSAMADVPTGVTATLSQSPAGPGAIDPGLGNTIIYTLTFTNPATFGANGDRFTAELDIDNNNFFVFSVVCSTVAGTTATPDATPPEVGCSWEDNDNDGLEAGVYTVTVMGYARPGADNDVDPPTGVQACHEHAPGDNGDCDDEGPAQQLPVSVAAGVAVLTINPNTVSPATATVRVATFHTITWTLKDGYTCESDGEANTTVECTAGDVAIFPPGAALVVGAPTVTDSDIADETFVSVTVLSNNPGTALVTLRTHFVGDVGNPGDFVDPDQVGVDDVTAVVMYTTAVRLFGDVDCDGDVDAVDALKILRFVNGLPVSQTEPCPDIGTLE